MNNNKIVAIIPARGGSKSIPKKNIKLINGKPLIAYAIKAVKDSKYVDEVCVSTDDNEIAEISERFGAKIIQRPSELATDSASSESVLLHFAENMDFDILVFLQCTSPLTTSKDIDEAIELFLSKKYDSILSVCEDRGGFLCGGFIWDEDGNSVNYDFKNRQLRQYIKKKTYRENGAMYIMSKEGLLQHKNRLYGKVGLYKMSKYKSFEIDDPEDFEFIEHLLLINKKYKQNVDADKIKNIKMVLFDVDGIFTDGSVYLDNDGKETLKFSRVDGKGVELLRNSGYLIGIISSEDSDVVKHRMNKLKINEIHLGIKDKIQIYKDLKMKYGLKDKEICYCGDDVQDIEVLKLAGLSCCPLNAQKEVRNACNFKSNLKGGDGFVRDVCNLILSL